MPTIVSIQQGGTNANSASAALTNLGAAPAAAYDQANNAYAAANNSSTAVAKGGDTMTGTLVINASGVALNVANTAYFRGNIGIGVLSPTGSLDVSNRGITRGSLPAGSILQVVSNTITAIATISAPNGTEVSVTGYSATITPTSSTSKILVMMMINYGSTGTTYGGYFKRGSTVISQGDAGSGQQRVGFGMALASDVNQVNSFHYHFLDSPATTSSTTYQFFVNNDNTGVLYLNRSVNDTASATGKRATSTITLIEVAV